jgi:hypothetical protein
MDRRPLGDGFGSLREPLGKGYGPADRGRRPVHEEVEESDYCKNYHLTPSFYDLTWESQDGMLYNVWSTADLSEALIVSRGQASKRKTASILRPRLFSGVLFVQISTNQFPNKSQNQPSNHKHSCSQFGFWFLNIGTYLEIGSWKFPSLGPRITLSSECARGRGRPAPSPQPPLKEGFLRGRGGPWAGSRGGIG